ncbi:MAG: porin, partial [Pirellula sp.]
SRDLNQFQLKRARLIFSGHAFTPDFSYFIALDARSASNDNIQLLDYYLSYDLGHHDLGFQKRAFVVKAGQYKIPFTLARFISGQRFQFPDRSMASMYFDANRSLAVGLYGERRPWGQLGTWETAVFNGR